ncbi:hypothetical protein GCM10029978_086630 [Actinoallomurus acanthiterrae]
MSLVRKTIAATIVSGVALMGAAGTAEAATAAKPKPKQVVKHFHVFASGKKAQALGTVTFNPKRAAGTKVRGSAVNLSKTAVTLKVTAYRGKIVIGKATVVVKGLSKGSAVNLVSKKTATKVVISIGNGKPETVTPKRVF